MKEGKPINLSEFMYPLMQGYDSVAMDVDGEIGGNDQTWNMLAGRDLMKTLKNKEKFVIATKLLVDSTGKKMGKTENKRYGRPCDVLQWDSRSFFISDDKNGVIYYIWKEK